MHIDINGVKPKKVKPSKAFRRDNPPKIEECCGVAHRNGKVHHRWFCRNNPNMWVPQHI
jgi:hypothetical protein